MDEVESKNLHNPRDQDFLDLEQIEVPLTFSTSFDPWKNLLSEGNAEYILPKNKTIKNGLEKFQQGGKKVLDPTSGLGLDPVGVSYGTTTTQEAVCFADEACILPSNLEESLALAIATSTAIDVAEDSHAFTSEETARHIMQKLHLPQKSAEKIKLQTRIPKLVAICEKKLVRDEELVDEIAGFIRGSIYWGKSKLPEQEYLDTLKTHDPYHKKTRDQKAKKDKISKEYNLRSLNSKAKDVISAKFTKENFRPP